MPTDLLDAARVQMPEEFTSCALSSRRRRADSRSLRTLCARLTADRVDSKPGYVVLTGLGPLDELQSKQMIATVSEFIGPLLPQDANGALIRDVRDRGIRLGQGRTGRYSDSRDGGNLHTDGPHAPFSPPDYFALYCVRQARVGGALALVHLDDVIARLSPQALLTLSTPYHFDRREDIVADPTVTRAIISSNAEGYRICYLREYIEIGHRHPQVPRLTSEQCAALDALDRLLNDPTLQRVGTLRPGELIVVNNRVLCHGRTTFEDDPQPNEKRLLLRTWIRRAGVPLLPAGTSIAAARKDECNEPTSR